MLLVDIINSSLLLKISLIFGSIIDMVRTIRWDQITLEFVQFLLLHTMLWINHWSPSGNHLKIHQWHSIEKNFTSVPVDYRLSDYLRQRQWVQKLPLSHLIMSCWNLTIWTRSNEKALSQLRPLLNESINSKKIHKTFKFLNENAFCENCIDDTSQFNSMQHWSRTSVNKAWAVKQ